MYPNYVDLTCFNCGQVILIKKLTFFDEEVCEMEFGGSPEVTCNFCGAVVGVVKPIEKASGMCSGDGYENRKWD